MNNILITGANGFLGSNLVRFFLEKNYPVIAVIRANGNNDNLVDVNCKVIEYDGTISSLSAHINVSTTVIHTASYYVAEHNDGDVADLVNSNVIYGMNLLEAMRITGAKEIINIGTAWQGYQGEENRPVNLYAATKQAFENFIAYYCDAEGFKSVSLRLNDTYGEEDKRMKLVKLLINSGLNDINLDMSLGEQRINLTHISDVCRAIHSSVECLNNVEGLVTYNLINNDELSIRELVNLIERELEMKIPVNFGMRAYRNREVMEPIKLNPFNLCTFKIDIRDGVKKIYRQLNDK
jgi:CDP-paratose synthetase